MDPKSEREECTCHIVRRSHGVTDVASIVLENTICYILFIVFAIIFTASTKVDPISYYCNYYYEFKQVNTYI